MNFKIENNYLNISNYPSIERHFEDMASRGWLITRILMGNLFIYKKIKPEELDFSISPYEVETSFTRKTKEELEEFQTVTEAVGWNYATKSYDLHIYFKEKGSEAVAIQTDEEEDFKTLELLAKKQLKSSYFQIPFFIFLAWINVGRGLGTVDGMRDGLTQIVALLIPVGIIISVLGILDLRGFLKKNRKNIDLGLDIEFNDSRYYGFKICFFLFNIIILGFIIYLLYSAIIFKNIILLMALIPAIIGITVGTLYRIYVKPSKKSISYKKVSLAVTLLVATIISIGVGIFNIRALASHDSNPNINGYRVLSIKDFIDREIEGNGDLRRNISIFIPESYEYSSYARGHGVIDTEYSNTLNENLAKKLVSNYRGEAKNRMTGRYSKELEFLFENDIYDSYLARRGLTEDEFNNLKDKEIEVAVNEALEIIKQKSIVEDKDNLWKMDEVYFLNLDKSEIVIRNGKEVFFLGGLDFLDPHIIEKVKDRLELNRYR